MGDFLAGGGISSMLIDAHFDPYGQFMGWNVCRLQRSITRHRHNPFLQLTAKRFGLTKRALVDDLAASPRGSSAFSVYTYRCAQFQA